MEIGFITVNRARTTAVTVFGPCPIVDVDINLVIGEIIVEVIIGIEGVGDSRSPF
jgi:hypothetical protein